MDGLQWRVVVRILIAIYNSVRREGTERAYLYRNELVIPGEDKL